MTELKEKDCLQPVLVVEDEFLIAAMTETALKDLGFRRVVVARSIEDGLKQARTLDCAFAILDVNLNGAISFPIAEELRTRNIPFGFQTAYDRDGVMEDYRAYPILSKPFTEKEIQELALTLINVDS